MNIRNAIKLQDKSSQNREKYDLFRAIELEHTRTVKPNSEFTLKVHPQYKHGVWQCSEKIHNSFVRI